ncbi:hypothetical protein HYALB_00011504, partial [Hymenoscyphus albidus]
MAVLGLSILIVTFSFFCYRHPPSTWSFVDWFRERSGGSVRTIGDARIGRGDALGAGREDEGLGGDGVDGKGVEGVKVDIGGIREKGEDGDKRAPPTMIIHDAPSITTSTHDEKVQEPQITTERKGDEDRKAMPPPPPPTSTTSSPPTPRARSHTPQEQDSIPSFTLGDANEDEDEEEEEDLMPPPQFPALNSAQRAGGSATMTKSIPRLSPMAPPPPRGTSSLMAPPQRGGPLPNRNPLSSKSAFTNSSSNASSGIASGLTPPPTHTIPPPKPRKKVLLAPGRSPLDWATLTSSPTANLTGLPPGMPYLKVPPSLLKVMNGRKGKDAWTVLGGR